jgi:DNA-binding transcriptional ArsR family regulator
MKRRIGDSLKRAMAAPGESRPRIGACPLFNAKRAAAYQILLDTALSSTATVAHGLGLDRRSAEWHLASLADSGLVDRWVVSAKELFSPSRVFEEPSSVLWAHEALSPQRALLILTISAEPGLALAGPVRRECARLVEKGLLASKLDGRKARFYPGDGLLELASALSDGYERHRALFFETLLQTGVNYIVNPLRFQAVEYLLETPAGDTPIVVPGRPLDNVLANLFELYKKP